MVLAPPGAPVESEELQTPAATLLFRFGIGLAELATEGLTSALSAFDALSPARAGAAEPLPPAGPAPEVPATARHVVIGALAATPRALAAALARAAPVSTRARLAVERGGRLVRRAPGAGYARRRWDGWRARAGSQLAGWAEAGRREEIEGRALAASSLVGFFEAALAHVAESPDLKRVIEEQSAGVTVAAVTELRERSRRADSLVEAFARRLVSFRVGRSG